MTGRQRVRRRIQHDDPPPVAVQLAVNEAPEPIAELEVCVLPHRQRQTLGPLCAEAGKCRHESCRSAQFSDERFMGLLCRRHFHGIARTLDQIIELYALLPDAVLPGAGGSDGGRGGSQIYSPAPGRLAAMTVTDRRAGHLFVPSNHADPDDLEQPAYDVLAILGAWVARLIEEAGVRPFAVATPALTYGPLCPRSPACWHRSCKDIRGEADPVNLTLSQLVNALRNHRQWIAQQWWVPDFLHAMEDAHRALAQAAGADMWPRPIGACPACGRDLFNSPNKRGVDEVICRNPACKATWRGRDLTRLRLIHEQEGIR